MKFSCERCGKKYATAETPAAGRVYKIKCKSCGHLIVVKASAGAATTATTEMRAPTLAGIPAIDASPSHTPEHHPQATPDIQLEVAPPEPAAPAEEHFANPADVRYVDLFEDGPKEEPERPAEDPFLAAARASLPEGYGAGPARPDPFASLREELSAPPASATPPPRTPVPPLPPPSAKLPKIPAIPRPALQKALLPVILIVAGALVLVGILAYVLLGGSTPPPAPRQAEAPAAQARPPAPVAAPQPPPPAVPPPAAAAPAPPPPETPQKVERDRRADDDRRAREERRAREREREAREREAREIREREAREIREREAREARAARDARSRAEREAKERERALRDEREAREREARERDRLAREQRLREEREARDRERQERQRREAEKVASASADEEEADGLTQGAIEKVLRATRTSFESCIVKSGGSGEVKLDGRRVMLRLNIQSTGAVTYPTLDDVTLNGTELGSCLKSAARTMVFPKFKGDTMHVEVPLVLGR